MNTDRDMYYGNYGYASSMPFPNQMMNFPNQGFFPNMERIECAFSSLYQSLG